MNKIILTLLTTLITSSSTLYAQCWKSIGKIDGDTLSSSFAIKEDGTLWAWGLYGNGTTTSSAIPIQIGTDSNWKSINYSHSRIFGIKTDGTLWAWGGSVLGNGTTNSSLVPLQIGIETQWKDVSSAWHKTFALKNNGTLWFWGLEGQNGNTLSPKKIGTDADWNYIYNTYYPTYIIKNNGSLWQSYYYQSNNLILNPLQIGNETDFKLVISNYAIKTDGSLWYYSNYPNPFSGTKQKVGTNKWLTISETDHNEDVHGITTDGKLWKIVNGIATQVGNDSNWKEVTVLGGSYSDLYGSTKIALKTDGTLYTWGNECCGEFGNGYVDGLPIATPTIVNTPGCLASLNELTSSVNTLNVFPNPSIGIIELSLKEDIHIEHVIIRNAEGRTILEVTNPSKTIDISHFEKGAYFVICSDRNSSWTKLIIKE